MLITPWVMLTSALAATSVLTEPIVLPGIWSLSMPGALIGLVMILFLALTTNRLYTKGQHDEIVRLIEKRVDHYREAAEKWEAAYNSSDAQNRELAATAGITRDLFQRADLKMEGDERDAVATTQ